MHEFCSWWQDYGCSARHKGIIWAEGSALLLEYQHHTDAEIGSDTARWVACRFFWRCECKAYDLLHVTHHAGADLFHFDFFITPQRGCLDQLCRWKLDSDIAWRNAFWSCVAVWGMIGIVHWGVAHRAHWGFLNPNIGSLRNLNTLDGIETDMIMNIMSKRTWYWVWYWSRWHLEWCIAIKVKLNLILDMTLRQV